MGKLSSSADRANLARLVEQAVSPERLQRYVLECGGDAVAAVELYLWNAELSASWWATLGHVEIIVRNTLATEMAQRQQHRRVRAQQRNWSQIPPISWLDDPRNGLSPRSLEDIANARQRVRRSPVTDGRVIAELSLGFWRYLLSRQHADLWPSLVRGFPYLGAATREEVEQRLIGLHKLRNRIAHHEPIWAMATQRHHDDALALIGYINPDLRDWINQASTVPHTLTQRPTQPQGTA